MNKQKAVYLMLWPEIKDPLWKDIPILTTWTGFGLMWEAAQKTEWWEDFVLHKMLLVHGGPVWDFAKKWNPQWLLDNLYDFGQETGRIPNG